VHMIRHQMPFGDFALLLPGQFPKQRSQVLPQRPKLRLAAALRDEYHVWRSFSRSGERSIVNLWPN
jgi:hypothetical protein